MATPESPRRTRLASRLRELRAAAYPSGNQFARALGWVQSRVSKLERGEQMPTRDDLEAWVHAAGAEPDTLAELVGLLSAARSEHTLFREEMRRHGGAADLQARIAAAERQATRLGEYQPAMIPGLLQTVDYATELLTLAGDDFVAARGGTGGDTDALVTERIRRQEVLYNTSKTPQFVIGETALRSAPGTVATLLGQLDRLRALNRVPNVELGILAEPTPMPTLPISSFRVHDSDLVVVETLAGEAQLSDPADVALFVAAFERLRRAAAHGPDAEHLIDNAIHALDTAPRQ